MVRHISIFFFKKEVEEKAKKNVMKTLVDLEGKLKGVVNYHVGEHCLPQPVHRTDTTPLFGELVQMIDFTDREMAEKYPQSEEHMKMLKETCLCIEKVVVIDFEL